MKTLALAKTAGVCLAVVICCHTFKTLAQTDIEPATNIDWSTASDQQVLLQAIEQTTPEPASDVPLVATFYSAQHSPLSSSPWPPLPANVNNLGSWCLGSNVWLIDDLNFDYSAPTTPTMQAGTMMAMDDSGPLPPGAGGGGGTNILYPGGASFSFNPGTNLWIAQETVSGGNFTGILSNTIPGVEYQLLSENALDSTQWVFQGEPILATTNWAPWAVQFDSTTNFFLNAMSWQDDTGSGIPDWWWLKYFGQDTNVDPYADPKGDGWTLFQDYENGWNPTNWITPPAPQGLTISNFNSANNTASLSWLPSPGPVTGYTMQTSSGTIPLGNVTQYIDSESSVGANYSIEADYAGGPSAWSPQVSVQGPVFPINVEAGSGGNLFIIVHTIPPGVSALNVSRQSLQPAGDEWQFPYTTWLWEFGQYYPPDLPDGSFEIPVASVTNGVAQIPNEQVLPFGRYVLGVQLVFSNGLTSDFSGWTVQDLPFVDGRMQLKDNLRFVLRDGSEYAPFAFSVDTGSSLIPNPYNAMPPDYTYSSYYSPDSIYSGTGSPIDMDPAEPFENNFYYSNFVFNVDSLVTNFWPTFNNGVSFDSPYDPSGTLMGEAFPSIYFPLATLITSNFVTPSSVLSPGQTRWLVPSGESDWLGANFPSVGQGNYYGLQYLSLQDEIISNDVIYTDPVSPGNVPFNYTFFYPETAQPEFQTAGYYFARPNIDPMPEENDDSYAPANVSGFSPTNTTQQIIVGVGQSTQIAGYEILSMANGTPGFHSYLGQYFTNAYEVDTNGNATTNTTGMLSPYGTFYATEPGQVALKTMPDPDTGQQGTCTVYCVSLNVDKNHDGVMDTSFTGADATSQASPMEFWVNNGCDSPGASGSLDKDLQVPPNPPNYAVTNITCERDLENFARLWISGMPPLPTGEGYNVTFSMTPISGNLAINLYWSCEANGGTGYLADTNIAALQVTDIGGIGYGASIGTVSNNLSYTFPDNTFQFGGTQYLLFEGAGIGEGQLTMTISQNGNTLAQTSVYLDLHNVEDLYEQAHITNVLTTFPAMRNNTNPSSFVSDHELANNPNETNQLVVFVHGWRMGLFDYQKFSDTMFKRLYWQGYQGRFASLRWHTLSEDDFWFFSQVEAYQTYNPSEYIAFRSAQGTSDYFDWLKSRFPNYSISVAAHSMGNIVMMEALKIQLAEGHKDIDNYVLMQGAVPAECYDANAPGCPSLIAQESDSPTPDEYLTYPGAINNAITGSMVNFFNTNDYALNFWVLNQFTMKPDTTLGYTVGPDLQTYLFPSTLITDPREIMPFAARPRSYAVGAQPNIQGVISEEGQIDLQNQFGFTDNSYDHSGEFNRDFQQVYSFYRQLGLSLGIITPQTP